MKHKTSELEGDLLDAAVAKSVYGNFRLVGGDSLGPFGSEWAHKAYNPSKYWDQGGPIIERERIDLQAPVLECELGWLASIQGHEPMMFGPTPLIAAMRTFVASKLGDEVDL